MYKSHRAILSFILESTLHSIHSLRKDNHAVCITICKFDVVDMTPEQPNLRLIKGKDGNNNNWQRYNKQVIGKAWTGNDVWGKGYNKL